MIASAMTDTATIIGAIGAASVGIGAMFVAARNAITELNRLLADQHTRAVELKNNPDAQSSVSTNTASENWRPLGMSLFIGGLSMGGIVFFVFVPGVATNMHVALSGFLIVSMMVVLVGELGRFIVSLTRIVVQGQLLVLEQLSISLKSKLANAEKAAKGGSYKVT